MIPLWKRKNHIYFGVITIIPFDNLYRWMYFVMHTFLVIIVRLLFALLNEYIKFVTIKTSWINLILNVDFLREHNDENKI